MAKITIQSENKDLSWVLVKNPESGTQLRKVRQGLGYGWFTMDKPTEYNLYFKEGIDSDSFADTSFEYLSKNQFGHPYAHISLLNTFLSDCSKKVTEYDRKSQHKIILDQVLTYETRIIKKINQFIDIDVNFTELNKHVYRVEFVGNCTFNHMINIVLVVCLFLCGRGLEFLVKMDEGFLNKYTDIINKLNLPYYLRYVFSSFLFKHRTKFNKYCNLLNTENIKLAFGTTALQRLRYVEKKLSFTCDILDFGCGSGMYAFNFAKNNVDKTYHALDIDNDSLETINKRAKGKELTNIKTYNDLDQIKTKNPLDIILIEVIEHVDKSSAAKILRKLLKMNFGKLIITTPNKDFNVNYLLEDDELRHADHCWEMGKDEFVTWFSSQMSDIEGIGFEFVDIGDSVDGVFTTQGVIVQNLKAQPQAVICVGASASGKSTYAGKICSADNWVEINRDNIRFKNITRNWNQYHSTPKREQKVNDRWKILLNKSIENQKNLVISDTNLNKAKVSNLKKQLSEKGYHVEIKYFDVEFEELLRRDQQREGGVGYEVLLSQYIRYQRQRLEISPYKPTGTPNAIIFDIDGTLAKNGDRSPYDLSKVIFDVPIQHVVAMLKGYFSSGHDVYLLSGREESSREQTEKWLKKHDIPYKKLLMRETNDLRKDYIVKMELFEKHFRNKIDVLAVVDDRKQVIESCWHVLGVPVISVGKWNKRF